MRSKSLPMAWIVAALAVGGHLAVATVADAQQTAEAESTLQPLDFSHPPQLPSIDPPTAAEMQTAIDRGVQFLIADQNPNGSWGSATNTKDLNIYAPVPGAHHAFRTATTSLCLSALLEVAAEDPAAAAAIERGEAWLVAELPRLRRATGMALYNVWGHAYSIQALLRLRQRYPRAFSGIASADDSFPGPRCCRFTGICRSARPYRIVSLSPGPR